MELTLTADEAMAVEMVWRRWRRPDVQLSLRRLAPDSSGPRSPRGRVLRIDVSPLGYVYYVHHDGELRTRSGLKPTWERWAQALLAD